MGVACLVRVSTGEVTWLDAAAGSEGPRLLVSFLGRKLCLGRMHIGVRTSDLSFPFVTV